MIGWNIKLSVQTFQPLIVIYKRSNFIEDKHQFIGHCLIPQDPYFLVFFIKFSIDNSRLNLAVDKTLIIKILFEQNFQSFEDIYQASF